MEIMQKYETKISQSKGEEKIKILLEYAEKIRQKNPLFSQEKAINAYNESKLADNEDLELKSIYAICAACIDLNDLECAEKWIEKLAERGTETGHNEAIAGAYDFRYRINRTSVRLTEAAENLNEALEFLNEEEHSPFMSNCYIGLGNIHFQLEDYDVAQKYYEKAVPLAIKYSNGYYYLKQNLASVNIMKKNYQKAWEIYHNLLDIMPESAQNIRLLVMENLGHVCDKLGEYNEALDYFSQVTEILEDKGAVDDLIKLMCYKADILRRINQQEAALEIYKDAEEKAKKSVNVTLLEEVYEGMIRYFEDLQDYKTLSEYQKKYIELKDRIIKETNLRNINESKINHQIDKYKEQTKLLSEKNKLILERNKTLKDTMDRLVSKNKDLQVRLKNSFSTIKEKDVLLTTNQRMASIGEMIAIIAHQWKQPLNIINALVYSIKDAYKYEELNESLLDEKSKMIEDLVEYLSQTLNDFRNFFKEQDDITFPVSEAIKKTLNLLDFALESENVIVTENLQKDFELSGSPNELTQVFLNLINNARDAFIESKTKSPMITITLREDKSYNIVDIYDNGGTIPEEIADNLFEAYVTSKGEKGTGLGLNICKKIIEDHYQGRISYQNIKGGVNFKIEFPI